jgi:HAMP domain-containing protein
MFSKLPFRTKLVLVVSAPLFVLVGFAGMGIASRFVDLSAQEQYSDLTGPFSRLTSVGRSVGDESVASAWFAGDRSSKAAKQLLGDARRATDAATRALASDLRTIREHAGAGMRNAVRELLGRLDGIDGTRERIDAGTDSRAAFNSLAREALDDAASLASNVNDRELSASLGRVVDLERAQLAFSIQASTVESNLVGAIPAVTAWVSAINDEDAFTTKFMSTAVSGERDAFARGSSAAPVDPVRDASSGSDVSSFPTVDITPAEYADAYLARQTALDDAVGGVQSVIDETAQQKVSDARTGALLFAGFTAAVIGMVLILALALVRSLSRPLRALSRAARDVSERRLPQLVDTLRQGGELAPGQLEELSPIRVDSPDEFGELATAFNTIQRVTVSVAEEQSSLLRKGIGDLYVNLARRNQSLLDRQISLLDEMEAREQRSEELGLLFELDQLATRMRRNAESLLVLAGSEQPRQLRTAVSVLDVVRGAAAEIADFARVSYFGFDDAAAIAGHAVADVTHLLAELLENATGFAPPDTSVVVSGQALDRRYLVTITDEGIGMEDKRLLEANQLLARPPAAGLTLSRTLGLHVVGHLAARHGIHVQLRRVPGAGLSAVVAIPATIIVAPGDLVSERPPSAAAPAIPAEAFATEPSFAAAPPVVAETVDGRAPVAWRPAQPAAMPRRVAPTTAEPVEPVEPVVPAPTAALAPSNALVKRVPAHDASHSTNGVHTGAPASGNGSNGNGLAARVPGANLTHQPSEPSSSNGNGARPRPERVREMLARHERGVQEGRDSSDRRGDE